MIRGLVFLLLASCAVSSGPEERASKVTAPVVLPDDPRSIASSAVLDEVDTTTSATAGPAASPIHDTFSLDDTGPVPDPWQPTWTGPDGDKKKD